MTKQIVVLACVLAVAVATPASAQNREHQQMAADARMLQEQMQQIAISVTELSQALTESIKALNARLDAANDATRKGFADQKLLIDNLGSNVLVIRERSDDTNVRMGSLREEIEAMRSTVQALQQMVLTPPQPAAPVDPNAPPVEPSAPAPLPSPAPPPSTIGLSPTRMYDTALTDYFGGQYAAAISGFEAFLRAFPKYEFSDDAYFNIGEANYALNRFPEAIAAYNQVIQNYPGTNAVPEAYYKRGLAQDRSAPQQTEAARASWEAVIKLFPDSAAAQLARQGLDRIGRAAPPQ